MKKITLLLTICLLISGCQLNEGKIEASDSSADDVIVTADAVITSDSIYTEPSEISVQTIETSAGETEITESIYVPDYEVRPMDFDLSFDDVFNIWIEYIGIDMNSIVDGDTVNHSVDYNDYHINYEPDYQAYVQHMSVPNSEGYSYFNPSEVDYHIIRYLRIDDLIIYEFDSQAWAEEGFRTFSDDAVINDTETDDSSLIDGYCFIYRTDSYGSYYDAFYYWDNYVLKYGYNFVYGNPDSYDRYINLCELLGLPTSDYITQNYFGN